MQIRKATREEVPQVLQITKACANDMISKGIYQWDDEYPSYEAFQKDVERSELFVLETQNRLVGCITISTFMDEEYKTIDWLTPSENNIYIHRLAVHPEHQRKGYAQALMNFAEEFSRNNSFTSVRLDTFSVNERNNKFYQQRGYKKIGEVYFPRQSDYSFYCYELVL